MTKQNTRRRSKIVVTKSFGLDEKSAGNELVRARACVCGRKKRRSPHSNVYRWLKGAVADFERKNVTSSQRCSVAVVLLRSYREENRFRSRVHVCFSMLQGKIAVYKHTNTRAPPQTPRSEPKKDTQKHHTTVRPNTQVCRRWERLKKFSVLCSSASTSARERLCACVLCMRKSS